MTYIYDASFGHAQITPQAVKGGGADGVILYAGCWDSSKNCTKVEVQALLDAGLQVGLVIENYATDAIRGASVGDQQGQAILAAAKALGYDTDNCVLFGGYDTDSHESDWPKLLAYMEAFASHVPVPGFYGDSDAIDYLAARHPNWIFWQSDSRSFSPKNPTPNAHLLQLYNDPRAHGLPVDVDIVEKPLPLMGADTLTDADKQDLVNKIKQAVIDSDGETVASALRRLDNIGANVLELSKAVADLTAKVAALQAPAPQPVDVEALAASLVQHLAVRVVSK